MDKIISPSFGGSSIEKYVFDYIKSIIKSGSVVLEFGGGDGSTLALGSVFKLYTVEQDLKWMKHPNVTSYIHCPLKNGWYDSGKLRDFLPNHLDLILIDGPSGEDYRRGVLGNIDILKRSDNIIVHDTWRDSDKKLATDIAKEMNIDIVFFDDGDFWAHIFKKQ